MIHALSYTWRQLIQSWKLFKHLSLMMGGKVVFLQLCFISSQVVIGSSSNLSNSLSTLFQYHLAAHANFILVNLSSTHQPCLAIQKQFPSLLTNLEKHWGPTCLHRTWHLPWIFWKSSVSTKSCLGNLYGFLSSKELEVSVAFDTSHPHSQNVHNSYKNT